MYTWHDISALAYSIQYTGVMLTESNSRMITCIWPGYEHRILCCKVIGAVLPLYTEARKEELYN